MQLDRSFGGSERSNIEWLRQFINCLAVDVETVQERAQGAQTICVSKFKGFVWEYFEVLI